MGNFLKLCLVIAFNIVAVAMIINNTDDIRINIGIIFLLVLFFWYQLIPDKK